MSFTSVYKYLELFIKLIRRQVYLGLCFQALPNNSMHNSGGPNSKIVMNFQAEAYIKISSVVENRILHSFLFKINCLSYQNKHDSQRIMAKSCSNRPCIQADVESEPMKSFRKYTLEMNMPRKRALFGVSKKGQRQDPTPTLVTPLKLNLLLIYYLSPKSIIFTCLLFHMFMSHGPIFLKNKHYDNLLAYHNYRPS